MTAHTSAGHHHPTTNNNYSDGGDDNSTSTLRTVKLSIAFTRDPRYQKSDQHFHHGANDIPPESRREQQFRQRLVDRFQNVTVNNSSSSSKTQQQQTNPIAGYKNSSSSSTSPAKNRLNEAVEINHDFHHDEILSSSRVVFSVDKYIPVPPESALYTNAQQSADDSGESGEGQIPYSRYTAREREWEQQEMQKAVRQFHTETLGGSVSDRECERDQWLARAMKRNTEILTLFERMRPLSQRESFSRRILEKYGRFSSRRKHSNAGVSRKDAADIGRLRSRTKLAIDKAAMHAPMSSIDAAGALSAYRQLAMTQSLGLEEEEENDRRMMMRKRDEFDFSDFVSQTESREVLSRETLLQLIHQHLATKGLNKAIEALGRESGVKCEHVSSFLCVCEHVC